MSQEARLGKGSGNVDCLTIRNENTQTESLQEKAQGMPECEKVPG